MRICDKIKSLCMLLFFSFFVVGHNSAAIFKESGTVISESQKISQTLITKIEISDNNKYQVYSSQKKIIELSSGFKYIKIDFTASQLNKNEIVYSLSPPDEDPLWFPVQNNDFVILSKLKPGRYIFLLTVKDQAKKINKEDGLIIIVKQHRFGSKKAIFLYVLFFILLIVLFLNLQTRTLRKVIRQFRERDKLAIRLMNQKEELAVKNKNITDSITYAKRIQNALMPNEKSFRQVFPDSFILHISKDIVSGDFYWINETREKIFLAAVDCTGHGVPGAFISIIGFELFRKITNTQGINEPAEILNTLNEDFKTIFKDVDDFSFKDGMDVAFCSIDKKRNILEFSGAFNPLYLIRNNNVIEIKGDRYAIGLDATENAGNIFTNHTFKLENNDVFYIFTDGYADQFGGPEGKKYKYRRFRHLLLNMHHLPMQKQRELLHKSIMEWKGELDQVDDILVIGVKFKGRV